MDAMAVTEAEMQDLVASLIETYGKADALALITDLHSKCRQQEHAEAMAMAALWERTIAWLNACEESVACEPATQKFTAH
jgi:hypothetical protein